MVDSTVRVTASAAAENTGTGWLKLRADHSFFDISVSGTFAATVSLQRKRPGEAASAAREAHVALAGRDRRQCCGQHRAARWRCRS